MTEDSLRQIAEDAFLLAYNITSGDLGEELDKNITRDWRAMELIIEIGERICKVGGITNPWMPTELQKLVEV